MIGNPKSNIGNLFRLLCYNHVKCSPDMNSPCIRHSGVSKKPPET